MPPNDENGQAIVKKNSVGCRYSNISIRRRMKNVKLILIKHLVFTASTYVFL